MINIRFFVLFHNINCPPCAGCCISRAGKQISTFEWRMLDGKKCLSAVSARFPDIILASMCGFCLCLCLWFLDIVPAGMFGCVVVWLCGYRFLDIVPASMCGCQSGRCWRRNSLCVSSPGEISSDLYRDQFWEFFFKLYSFVLF